MKKIVLFIMLMLPVVVSGQKDVTTFLGIPVDGSKDAMIHQLAQKGFKRAPYGKEYDMTGEFNGEKVKITIATNNKKVWRIIVCDAISINETDIKIRFNKLVSQFSKNSKYATANFEDASSFLLSEDEEIGFGISLYHKRYEAVFYQQPDLSLIDTVKVQNEIKEKLKNKFGEQRILYPDEIVKNEAIKLSLHYFAEIICKKSVWFMISEKSYGEYYIVMFYDNEYNHSNGEEL